MPIYEYECQECGRVFEKIQRFSDDPLSEYECEACGRATPVKKLVSAAAFHLKGGGWYVTDFRGGGKAGPKDSGSSGADGSGSAGSSGSSSTEKKSDAKGGSSASTATAG
jgi:putative FmdB family regulatory protein